MKVVDFIAKFIDPFHSNEVLNYMLNEDIVTGDGDEVDRRDYEIRFQHTVAGDWNFEGISYNDKNRIVVIEIGDSDYLKAQKDNAATS